MRLPLSVVAVVGTAMLVAVGVSRAKAAGPRGFAHAPGIASVSSASNYGMCSCMPMRSQYLYGYANPGYHPGYGSGYGYYPGTPYGPGAGYVMPPLAPAYAPASAADSQPQSSMQSVASLTSYPLDAGSSASSSNINWPVGLRVLAPTDVGGLRQQVQDLFAAMTLQRASGTAVNPQLAAEARHALDRLQRLVNQDKMKAGLPQAVNQEAERFVAKLRDALHKLQEA